MLPATSISYLSEAANTDAIFFGYVGTLAFFTAYLFYQFLSEFCHAVGFAGACSEHVSAFRNFIHRVIEIIAEKKMVWARTARVIALMKYVQPFRNFFNIALIRKSMYRNKILTPSNHSSIPVLVFYAIPVPTSRFMFHYVKIEIAIESAVTCAARYLQHFISTSRTILVAQRHVFPSTEYQQ